MLKEINVKNPKCKMVYENKIVNVKWFMNKNMVYE